jgi:hypothetical protein
MMYFSNIRGIYWGKIALYKVTPIIMAIVDIFHEFIAKAIPFKGILFIYWNKTDLGGRLVFPIMLLV